MTREDWTICQHSTSQLFENSTERSFTDYFPVSVSEMASSVPENVEPASVNGWKSDPSHKMPSDLKLGCSSLCDTAIHFFSGEDRRSYTKIVNIDAQHSCARNIQNELLMPGHVQPSPLGLQCPTAGNLTDNRPMITRATVSLWPLAWALTALAFLGAIFVLYFVMRCGFGSKPI